MIEWQKARGRSDFRGPGPYWSTCSIQVTDAKAQDMRRGLISIRRHLEPGGSRTTMSNGVSQNGGGRKVMCRFQPPSAPPLAISRIND